MKQHTIALAILALGAIQTANPAPTRAIAGTAVAALGWYTSGNANPFLAYTFESYHDVSYSQYNAAQALSPVVLTGQMSQGSQLRRYCTTGGFVNDIHISCSSPQQYLICPAAEGVWKATTRATAVTAAPLGFILAAATGPTYANCPPVQTPCQLGIPTEVDRVISLDTGLPVDASALTDLPSVRLQRRSEDAHGEFMLDEWAIVEPAANRRVRVQRASSETYAQHLDGEPRPLLDTMHRARGSNARPSLKTGSGRYLVVQGSGHRHKLPLPMVRLDTTPQATRVDEGARRLVTLRAFFDHHGQLHDVETLDGDAGLTRLLAEALRLDFVEGAEHRAAIYAVFEVGGGAAPKLLSAVPVLPRCCCGLTFCV
ncbi:MAG: hypothetical protein AAGE94_24110 [Acidobacteriota bacterium]